MITRKEWGAAPSKHPPIPHRPARIVIHHSYRPTAADYLTKSVDERIGIIRGIQRYHQQDQGWHDIGYHYLIGPDGEAYEGRPPTVVGSHCGGLLPDGARRVFGNSGSIGICLIGDYDRETPSAVMLEALNRLIAELMARFGLDTTQVRGHFEAWSRPPKTCPGIGVVRAMAAINPAMLEAWNQAYPGKAGHE